MPFPANGGPAITQVFSDATGESGASTIGGLVPSPYTVIVHQQGFARFWQTINLTGSSNITYSLTAGVTMSGAIANSRSVLIPQATVMVYDPVATFLSPARTPIPPATTALQTSTRADLTS